MKHLFNLGDIVALKSHPYSIKLHNVLISGEPQLVSPLMVIVEIIRDLQDVHDEFTVIKLQTEGENSNCKCIWYSSKSAQFEEAWLSSKLLKLIQKKGETLTLLELMPKKEDDETKKEETDLKQEEAKSKKQIINTIVTLSTARLEISKVKSSLNIENEKERTNLNPLLSFVSPLMQVIGIPKNDKKEALFDIKNGKQKKEISAQLIKCKWFNPSSDKMSEALIPIEALSLIPSISEAMLNEYVTYAKNKQHLTITIEGSPYQTIFLPQKIKYQHGIYYVVGYDYIKNKSREFEILKLSYIKLGSPFVKQAPNFKNIKLKSLSPAEQVKRLITEGMQNKKYLRIKYNDRNSNITVRTLKEYLTETISFDENSTEYLNGICELRESERYFKIDRIQSAEILNISYE